jgi:hypothetical protein
MSIANISRQDIADCPKEGWRRVWPISAQGVYHDKPAADAVDGSSIGATSAIDVVLLGHS